MPRIQSVKQAKSAPEAAPEVEPEPETAFQFFGKGADENEPQAPTRTNTIIGEPIQTPDGVTLIPVSRLSFGFGCGGGDYGKQTPAMFGGASTAGVKVEPVAFLVVKDGVTRVLPVGVPAVTTAARMVEMVPEVMDRVEHFIDKRKEEKESF